MTETDDMARAAMRGESRVLADLATMLIRPERDNLVERPWGGDSIRRFKGIPSDTPGAALPWGEAFEISACNDDLEAARFPSRIRFDDGSIADLPDLLEAQGETLLGAAHLARYGACFPLLPKTLSVRQLLSVQGHPAGHTEVYIIIDAEPGATLRVGFNRDIDAVELTQALQRGIERQTALQATLGPAIGGATLQTVVAPWFAERNADLEAVSESLAELGADTTAVANARELLVELKQLYWRMLDSMNAIEVTPGQVIYNATPKRLLAASNGVVSAGASAGTASAEVHALGNPEGREILALEIRRPGPTFRAWDNVRFPPREVGVADAIAALNLRATRAEEFLCELVAVPGREGTFVSVDCEYFRVEHLVPDAGLTVTVPAAGRPATAPHALHCLAGAVDVVAADGRAIGQLNQGESALVPFAVGAYRVHASEPARLVRVTLPEV